MKNLKLVIVSSVVAASALAGPGAPPPPQRAVIAVDRSQIPEPALSCPAGTQQSGGQASIHEASFCARAGAAGATTREGPFVSLHANGKIAVQGQYANGLRTGLWQVYDAKGAKVEEVSFLADRYQGTRTQWIAGKKSLEETYVAGLRQGEQRQWDAAGAVTVVRFVDDRPQGK
jgi:hypothetical protein